MAALLLLGFASGLPLLLTGRTLQAWMKDANVDLATIGWFSLIGLPYTLKFVWSPFLDRYKPMIFGRRRSWLFVSQVGLIAAIAAMAVQQPQQALELLALNAMLIACLSATQDIAGDAYRTDVLRLDELGVGASVWVFGYRIAVLVSGSLTLILADYLPWPIVYVSMAGLMLLGLTTTLWAPEPPNADQAPPSLIEAVYQPFQEFFQRLGWTIALPTLLFIVLYRLADSLVNNMATPFLLDIGFSKTVIGGIQGSFGFIATTVGVLGGGALLTNVGLNRALWICGVLQAVSNLGYFALAVVPKTETVLLLAINIENFCGGMVAAVFVAYLMSLCNHQFTATQYALLSSLMASAGIILAAPAGEVAKAIGWPSFFLVSMASALPSLFLLLLVAPWNAMPTAPESAWDDPDL